MGIVEKIGHVRFESPDVERLSEYYRNILGLAEMDRDGGAIFLACPRDHHSVVIEKGSEPRCRGVALELSSEADLDVLARRLAELGVTAEQGSDTEPGVARRLRFPGPGGVSLEALAPRSPCGREPEGDVIGPQKLGHMALKVVDPRASTDFLVEALDFRESDWMGDFFAFLRCGPDHHTLNLLRNPVEKMHHIAFEVADIEHIKRACDFLGRRRIELIWGPGRHGPGHNIFTYHYNPDGQIVELFCEIDRMSDEERGYFDPRPWHEDEVQRPKVWEPGPQTSNIWGISSPPSFRE